MSLSIGLSNALSGLAANGRATELISSNIANALTPGYARREIQLSARAAAGGGQGVSVAGTARITNTILISDRRAAEAGRASAARIAEFQLSLETALGTPEKEGSIGAAVDSISASLITASANPDSTASLDAVLRAAQNLAGKFNAVADDLQEARSRADDRIAETVSQLNTTLAKVDDLNAQILRLTSASRDASGLVDQRQNLIDSIAEIVPLREFSRDNGEVVLISTGGAVLLDGKPAVFGFIAAGMVTADMSVEAGSLSGLTLNGKPITPGSYSNKLDGGTLAADFAIRDSLAPAISAQLDAAAQDLVARFSAAGLDPTLSPGAAGLFTDGGGVLDPKPGLAGRLVVNAAVEPANGGAVWRLREGIGAGTETATGQSSLLTKLNGALTAVQTPAAPAAGSAARSFSGLLADLVAGVSARRVGAEDGQSYAAARYSALRRDELSMGVDTDAETQALMVIEQAYAANAKVISVIDDLLKTLLEM